MILNKKTEESFGILGYDSSLARIKYFFPKNSITYFANNNCEPNADFDEYFFPKEDEMYAVYFEEIRKLLADSNMQETIRKESEISRILLLLNKLNTRYYEQPIYWILKSLFYFIELQFVEAESCALKAIQFAETPLQKSAAHTIAVSAAENFNLLVDYRNKFKGLTPKSVLVLGCENDLIEASFYWTHMVYNQIFESDLNIIKNDYARLIRANLLYSYLYPDYKECLAAMKGEPDYYVFVCHAGENVDEQPLLELDMLSLNNIRIKFREIYLYIRCELQSNAQIVILGCNLTLNEEYRNVIYFDRIINETISIPFVKFYFRFISFGQKIEELNFEMAKTFTSLFQIEAAGLQYRKQ